jgi:hypothetical protein
MRVAQMRNISKFMINWCNYLENDPLNRLTHQLESKFSLVIIPSHATNNP